MPSFAAALETTLHNALTHASERRHEYATLEHLLLALICKAPDRIAQCDTTFTDSHGSAQVQNCYVTGLSFFYV